MHAKHPFRGGGSLPFNRLLAGAPHRAHRFSITRLCTARPK